MTPRPSLTKTHRPSVEVITPNGSCGTGVIIGRTPASVRAGATATLHPGTLSEVAGTADGNGATEAAAEAGGPSDGRGA